MTVITAVGGAKLGYAFMTSRAVFLARDCRIRTTPNFLAGAVMVGIGVALIATNPALWETLNGR